MRLFGRLHPFADPVQRLHLLPDLGDLLLEASDPAGLNGRGVSFGAMDLDQATLDAAVLELFDPGLKLAAGEVLVAVVDRLELAGVDSDAAVGEGRLLA